MAKCKTCGTVVSSPKKKWTMVGRPSKTGKRVQLEIGLFDCPKCKKSFREVLSKKIT
jgi:ribosomal protein L34E